MTRCHSKRYTSQSRDQPHDFSCDCQFLPHDFFIHMSVFSKTRFPRDFSMVMTLLRQLLKAYFLSYLTEGKNQALVGALPFCGEYPGPRSEDKFRSSNQMDGISIADGGKMADS